MSTFEELKKNWNVGQVSISPISIDRGSLEKIFKLRIIKRTNRAFKYFWASLAYQIVVYALLCHVMVRFWNHNEIVIYCTIGIIVFLPFTILFMNRFKKIARSNLSRDTTGTSLYHHVQYRHNLLLGFYRFKKWYEVILVPIILAICILIIFKIWVPGDLGEHITGALATYFAIVTICAWAISKENKNNFEKPLKEFEQIIMEIKDEQ